MVGTIRIAHTGLSFVSYWLLALSYRWTHFVESFRSRPIKKHTRIIQFSTWGVIVLGQNTDDEVAVGSLVSTVSLFMT